MAKVQIHPIETPRPVRGTQDIFGEEQERFQHVVETFERVRRLYGFRGVQMPVFEPTAVFARSLGETTDVVSKEMYSFEDRGGDSLTLRPEFTAGICRAFLTNGWQQHAPMKLSTHGPLFRYERPQKGRYRQFHQLDAEVIGASEAAADVELLCFADQLLNELGISDGVTLQLNTLGDAESRDAWRAALVAHFSDHQAELSEDSKTRLEKNPLRILDSKAPNDKAIVADAPTIDAYLTSEAAEFFAEVTEGLDACGVKWARNSGLVRGFDYYRHTAFEFIPDAGSAAAEKMGSQSTLLGGGRFDGLMEALGGQPTPAVGWAAGIERLGMLLDQLPFEDIHAVVVPASKEAEKFSIRASSELRRAGIKCYTAFKGNMKKRLQRANSMEAMLALLVFENSLTLKNLRTGNQEPVTMEELASVVSIKVIEESGAKQGIYPENDFEMDDWPEE